MAIDPRVLLREAGTRVPRPADVRQPPCIGQCLQKQLARRVLAHQLAESVGDVRERQHPVRRRRQRPSPRPRLGEEVPRHRRFERNLFGDLASV